MFSSRIVPFVGAAALLLLFAKLYELAHLIRVLRRDGAAYAADLLGSGVQGDRLLLQEIAHVMERYDLPIKRHPAAPTRLLASVRPPALGAAVRAAFQYSWLMLVTSGLVLLADRSPVGRWFTLAAVCGLLAGVTLQVCNLLWHQYTLGAVDIIQRSLRLRVTEPGGGRPDARWGPNQPYRDFLGLLLKTLFVFLVAFTAVYWGLSGLSEHAFDNLSDRPVVRAVELAYYSLATITTTGAGPVQPVWLWAQVAAALEIMAGIALLIFFGLGFSSAFQPTFRLVKPSGSHDKHPGKSTF